MAGDWIKLEHTTPDKPEVVRMAAHLNLDQDAVVGKLARIWIWADQNSIDGNALTVTDAFLDRVTACPGFAGALREVGWLSGRTGLLTIPNFDRHNGQTAKARAVTNRRVSRHRAQSESNGGSVTHVTPAPLQKPLPEKRREEDNTPKAPKSGGGIQWPPGPDQADVAPLPRQTYPPPLCDSPAFIECWEGEWLPYLLARKGRVPPIMTTEKHLLTCVKLGAEKGLAALKSAIEKDWAAPDENAKATNGAHFPSVRDWEQEPDDWKGIWREAYPPEDYADAPRYEDGTWAEVRADHKKHIHELAKKRRRHVA